MLASHQFQAPPLRLVRIYSLGDELGLPHLPDIARALSGFSSGVSILSAGQGPLSLQRARRGNRNERVSLPTPMSVRQGFIQKYRGGLAQGLGDWVSYSYSTSSVISNALVCGLLHSFLRGHSPPLAVWDKY